MRDPNRIEPILESIRKVWTKYPDFRLMQMLLNLVPHMGEGRYSPDPYFLEDDKLLDQLKLIYKDEISE